VWMAVRNFDRGTLRFDGPMDPGFRTLITAVPRALIDRYEGEVLKLPKGMRASAEEYHDLLYYARNGCPDPETIGPTPAGHFHPARYEPRYTSPEDEGLWREMIRGFELLSAMGFTWLLDSTELKTPETPDDPANFSGTPDIARLVAPPAEDPLAPRAGLTDDLHHLRVIARQLHRIWRPMTTHLNGREPAEGWSPSPEQFAEMTRLSNLLAASLITRYEAEVLRLPDQFRTSEAELTSFIRQARSRLSHEPGKPVPWQFDVRLHRPTYSEPADRKIWEACLGLLPDGLPAWFVGILQSKKIMALERRSRTPNTGGGSRPDDHETEPHGTEEDGPQPP
jgi:hypothetical protein